MSAARAAATAPARPLGRGRPGRPGLRARTASTRPATRPLPRAATVAASAAAVPAPVRPAREPRVRLVPPPASSRRRVPFGVLCGVVVLAALLAVLALNISLSRGAYHLHEVQAQQQDAAERRQALAEQLERTASPEELGRRAADLGMVEAGAPAFVELPDGRVTGEPEPAPTPTAAPDDTAADASTDTADTTDTAGTAPAADTAEESAD
ncbi:hypothetical protein WDZ17_04130 [Pseudokineococcus basanitobsidens]|uniref:Cell division protein FtsB n=1 Tax=Pseudokineococcus basanitobsidens TaxID=1926649 RepID=A0ABU8RHF9_9ACTN